MSPVQVAQGTHGMVVAGHAEAARAAAGVLAAGGSAADAAIAGAAVLTVALPQACTLGGDAFILAHQAAGGHTFGVNASGPSPALTTPDLYARGIAQRGALSCTVPGVVGGWQALHARLGSMPWNDLLAPAITLARDGIAVSPGLARSTEVFAGLLEADPGCRRLFLSDRGAPLSAGDTLRQPALAATLERIGREGAGAFYEGDIATLLASACEARGGLLRAADFRGYAPEWTDAIRTHYRGHDVYVMPPNSYGLYLLLQLMGLEGEPAAKLESAARLVRLATAARAAFAVGERAVADPAFNPEPFAPLLGEAGRERLRHARDGNPANRGGTAVISVVDADGNAVTIVQSVFLVFGSGVADAETGVLLNDRMLGFNADSTHPNGIAPRKRPAHTLCPAMVLRNGRLRYALGTPGGPGQTITLAQVIEGVLEQGMSLADAVATPRWSMDLAGAPVAEQSMSPDVLQAAQRLGLTLTPAEADSPFFGSAEAIELSDDGRLVGVADKRRDAAAIGVSR